MQKIDNTFKEEKFIAKAMAAYYYITEEVDISVSNARIQNQTL